MIKYLKIGPYYVAAHYDTNTVYMVRDQPKNYKIEIIESAEQVADIERYETAVEITAHLFQEKFSEIVEYISNKTPYA